MQSIKWRHVRTGSRPRQDGILWALRRVEAACDHRSFVGQDSNLVSVNSTASDRSPSRMQLLFSTPDPIPRAVPWAGMSLPLRGEIQEAQHLNSQGGEKDRSLAPS